MIKYKHPGDGAKINNWRIVGDMEIKKNYTRYWFCQCDLCKVSYRWITVYALMNNQANRCLSCAQKNNAYNMIHGKTNHRLYRIYKNIIVRCYHKNNKGYNNYGGRGITVCNEWLNDKTKFFDWAENNGYQYDLQIDRINNNGPYAPDNCRWITPKQNSWNTRGRPNKKSKYKGVSWLKNSNKWRASITNSYKKYTLGEFTNEMDAAKAYDKKAKELRGEYAYLNFPEENND